MQSCGTIEASAVLRSPVLRSVVLPKATPLMLRFVSKLVLEVLPAALASMIGAMLLAHYHLAQPALLAGGTPAAAAPAAASASPAMIRLVRDEHDQIRDFLIAQQAAQNSRYATADAQSAQAAADARLAAAAVQRAATVVAATPPAARAKPVAVASLSPAPPSVVVPAATQGSAATLAGLEDNAAPPTAPAHSSLVATTLAMKDHVVSATLHAVMAIGGIPSWIGHRFGSNDPDSGEQAVSATS
jgi:hypothetical protein